MIATVFRAFAVAVIIIALVAGFGLFIMAGIAATHNVVRVPVPSSSYLTSLTQHSDFSTAYRAPLDLNTFRNINEVAAYAFFRGDRELARTDDEVVYTGSQFGLHYFFSYMLDKQANPQTLTVVTLVRFRNQKGRYAWQIVGRIQHRLIPYLLDRMAQLAPD
jgi:hypothetical protein